MLSRSVSVRSPGVFLSARRDRLGRCLREAQTTRSSGSSIRLIGGIDPEHGERTALDPLRTRRAPASPIHGTGRINARHRRGLLNDRRRFSPGFPPSRKAGMKS
jgi:hypothetical protein